MLVIFIYSRDILKLYDVGLNLVRIEFPKVHIQYCNLDLQKCNNESFEVYNEHNDTFLLKRLDFRMTLYWHISGLPFLSVWRVVVNVIEFGEGAREFYI